MASTWSDSWGGSAGAWLASWDRGATVTHKADLVVGDRAATRLLMGDAALTTLSIADAAATRLTVRDHTRNE